jgi:DNA-directed RNA polymerase subunit RPC12/RpoP
MTRKELDEFMNNASREVRSWPDWKKANIGLLGHESITSCQTFCTSTLVALEKKHQVNKPTMCSSCIDIRNDTDEIMHESYIRCPVCKHTMNISNCDLSNLYEEGVHDVCCQNCDADFKVSTYVSFSFKSPALENR